MQRANKAVTQSPLVENSTPPVSSSAKGAEEGVENKETPFEALASMCSVLVIGLFILTFIGQNMVIPSGSMEKTLLVGDHLLVDRITLAPTTSWMPFVHYREPKRGDIVVFKKPSLDIDPAGQSEYSTLVKRLIGLPGDHLRLRNGIVSVNGVAQNQSYTYLGPEDSYSPHLDDFPADLPTDADGITAEWATDLPNHIEGQDLVVPPGMYFMMGDHRHHSLDSRFWGFVPRANIIGRPLFNYWSFKTPDEQMYKTSMSDNIAWMIHVAVHFFTDTRWSRTFHPMR